MGLLIDKEQQQEACGDAPGADNAPTSTGAGARTKDDEARERILTTVSRLGLDQQLCELVTQGFTVIRGVLDEDTIERAKAAILNRVENAVGHSVDPDSAATSDFHGMTYQHYLLFEDPVFPEILLQEKPLALITYLLGESCVLSSMGSHFRGPGGYPLPLHADAAPVGMTETASVANCNYALTPYSPETGALTLVPGSHRKNRHPAPMENWLCEGRPITEIMFDPESASRVDDLAWQPPEGSVAMDMAPGDAVIFHGNTWHGGWRRDVPGTRINLAAYFCRPHVATQERRGDTRYPEVFDRFTDNPRFAQLLALDSFCGWREEGPDYSRLARQPIGLYD